MSYFDNKLPTNFHLPEIVKGPWTAEARQMALDREILGHYIEYFKRAIKSRNWSPWHNFPLKEMREWGDRLSQETIDMAEGFLGVEEFVGDYVEEGLEMFRDRRTRRNLQLQWGAEEAKHGVAWEMVLKHSGHRTDAQLEEYFEKVREHKWTIKDHPGADHPVGVTAYAMVQERATYFNYVEMRARIREEYGLTEQLTPEEKARGYEVGASEAFRVVGIDEIAHHTIFLKVLQSHIKYFPSKTFEILSQVFDGFKMPSLDIIPNRRTFLRAIRRTGIMRTAEQYRDKVRNPILKSLGLEDDDAFAAAVQLARKLPENLGPDSVSLSRSGEWVVSYTPKPNEATSPA